MEDTDPGNKEFGDLDLDKAAAQAKLTISDSEREFLKARLEGIMQLVGRLDSVDAEGVPPAERGVLASNVFRTDEPRKGLEREVVLANAPEHDGQQFIVPQMV